MTKVFIETIVSVCLMSGLFSATVAGAEGYSDRDTAGLWLFDEFTYPHTTLTDANQYAKADLCLMQGGSMVPGRFGNALKVTGSNGGSLRLLI